MISEKRSEMIGEVANTMFAYSKEDEKRITDGLNEDATGFILKEMPALKAEVYYESVKATLNHINNMVPRLVMQTVKAMQAHDEAEKAFYGKYSALDKAKHDADVRQFSNLFKQANPQIKRDDLLAMVAAAVAGKHGLNLQAAAPAAPTNGTSHPSTSAPPFVPARPGATVVRTPEQPGQYDGLAGDYED